MWWLNLHHHRSVIKEVKKEKWRDRREKEEGNKGERKKGQEEDEGNEEENGEKKVKMRRRLRWRLLDVCYYIYRGVIKVA